MQAIDGVLCKILQPIACNSAFGALHNCHLLGFGKQWCLLVPAVTANK
jgi:hypothetical protein